MLKFGAGFAACIALIGYFVGAFGPSGYTREVSRPQAQVMAALEDLDISAQPGAPGSTPQNGVRPLFRLEKSADHMTWYVMSGSKVAVAMTAHFEPIDEGRKTRVRASVKRGDAPDDFVSPAFRSTGLTLGLFGMALEGELDKLTTPATYDAEKCRQLLEDFSASNEAAGLAGGRENLVQAIGQTGKAIIRLNAMQAELRRNGCPTFGASDDFHPVESRMKAGGEPRVSGTSVLGRDPTPQTRLDEYGH